MKEKSWKQIFKKLLCYYFFVGHKTRDLNNGHKECIRCGEKFFNTAKVVHKHKRLRHNKWGEKYFSN